MGLQDSRSIPLNLFLLFLVNFPLFVILALYDSLGAIGPNLLEKGINITSLGQLIGAYSIPTPFVPIIVGIIADKYSQALPTLGVVVITAIGTLLVWFANFDYWTIFAGRFLIGFSDALFSLQFRLYAFLFDGVWLGFAMAVSTIISQLGTVLVFALLPYLAQIDVNMALGCAFGLTVISGLAVMLFYVINYFYLHVDLLAKGEDEMKLSDILHFPVTFWCLCAIAVLSLVPYWVLCSFGPSFLVERNYTEQQAGNLISGMIEFVVLFFSCLRRESFCLHFTIFKLVNGLLWPPRQDNACYNGHAGDRLCISLFDGTGSGVLDMPDCFRVHHI
jgi:MFS family permease